MASLNRWTGIGNLTRDPEVKYMPSGIAVANVAIACNENWKDKDGNKQERVEFVNLVFYKRLAEIVGEYLKKGSQIYVEGSLRTRKWQDKSGNDRYTTEIVASDMQMLGGRQQDSGGGNQGRREPAPSNRSDDDDGFGGGFDDDIQFQRIMNGYLV